MQRLVYLLTLLFLVFGCTAKKIVVTHADMLLQNQIEKRLPLYSAQKKDLSKDIDKFLNEQKAFAREVIPVITELELNVDKVDEQYDKVEEMYQRLSLKFGKLMSRHMASLDEKQAKDFLRTLKEENHKLSKNRHKDRMKAVEDRFKMFFGSIKEEQRKIFDDHKKLLQERHNTRVERRKQLHQRFAEIYQMDESKEPKESREFYFNQAFADYQKNYPESPKNKEIIKQIIPTLTLKQKETFESKTKEVNEVLNYYLDTNY
jgi:hypothetical protein